MSLRCLLSFLVAAAICGGVVPGASLFAADAVPLRPIDLVGHDAALVGELRQPKAAWTEFRQGELFRRLEQSELYQSLTQSDGYRQWQEMERGVSEATGKALSTMLLDLCAQELVLAVYFSDSNKPEGVLLTRADDAATVLKVLDSWQKLEPKAESLPLKHQGQTYSRRSQVGPRKSSMYYVTFGEVFALSDQEDRIKRVIEYHQSFLTGPDNQSDRPQRLRDQVVYRQTTPASSQPAAAARLLLPARAWEPVLKDASPSDPGAVLLRRIWPAVDAVTMELRQDQGLHLEAKLHLHAERTDDAWTAWSAPTPKPEDFLATVPANAVVVAAGGIHFAALWKFLQDVVPPHEQDGWQKPRRVLRGFLGGRDLMDQVLPALGHHLGMYLVVSPREHDVPFDGVLVSRFPQADRAQGLHVALDQAFSAGLTLLSIQVNDKHPDEEPATVRSEVADKIMLRWLETPLPMRMAYQLTPEGLTVSRSIETLRRHLAAEATESSTTTFAAHRDRWFPDAGQFVCVDVRRLRDQSEPAAQQIFIKPHGENGDAAKFHLPRQLIRLCDVGYFATRFEPSRATVRIGVVAEPR